MHSNNTCEQRQKTNGTAIAGVPKYSYLINGRGELSDTTKAQPRKLNPPRKLQSQAIPAKPKSPPVVFRIDEEEVTVVVGSLSGDEAFGELQGRCNDSTTPVVISLVRLMDLEDRDRVTLIDFIASLSSKPRFLTASDSAPENDLLTAVLKLFPASDDLSGFAKAKTAALEVVALLHGDVMEVACSQILDRLRDLGCKGMRSDKLLSETRAIAKKFEQAATPVNLESASQLVGNVLSNAPVPDKTLVPKRWILSEAGIKSSREDAGEEISAPIVISGRGKDNAKGTEHLCLAWLRHERWQRRIVEREVVASTQKIIALAGFGFPVNSNNAKLVVQYLADFEAENMDHLPFANVTKKLGYQEGEGDTVFLWGKNLITADDVFEGEDLEQLGAEHWFKRPVHFQGGDEGDDQIAAGFHRRGTLERSKQLLGSQRQYPKVMLAAYSALAAPLLRIIRAPNFIVDFAGETTGGKSATLRLAASCFGNPDEQGSSGEAAAMSSWGATNVWLERAPAVMNHLPFILDDTKHARHPEDVAKTIYQVAQGRTRGRGTIKGTAGQETFSTVMLTSGEQPCTSFTEDGGTRGRVIEIWGSPFGKRDKATGQHVRRLNEDVKRHYGHIGPEFVQFLLKNREQWGAWRKRYEELVSFWEEMAEDNALAGRLAASFATINLTAELAHVALDLPWEYADPIAPLHEEIVREASDRPSAALMHVLDWANSHVDEFFNRRDENISPPSQGWAGLWPPGKNSIPGKAKASDFNFEWIGFYPQRLEEILKQAGIEPESTFRAWKERGWLDGEKAADGSIRKTRKKRVGDDTPRLIVIKADAFEAADRGA